MNEKSLLENLTFMAKLTVEKAPIFDTNRMEVEDRICQLEDKDDSKPYFIRISLSHTILFTRYGYILEELLELANSICLFEDLKPYNLSVTIFKTTEYGGSAVYNHSPLGMVLARAVNTDLN